LGNQVHKHRSKVSYNYTRHYTEKQLCLLLSVFWYLDGAIEAAEKDGKPLAEALADFEQAAQQGMESTKDMLAKMGRTSRLGERTIGHQDAGATSCYFILRSLASAVTD